MPGGKAERSSFIQKMDDFRRSYAIVLIWLLAIGGAVFIFQHKARKYQFIGLARGLEYRISSESGGKIESLVVDLFDDVNAGEIIAKLDDSLLEAQMRTARASIAHLQAQLEAARLNLATDGRTRLTDWQSKLADFEAKEEKYRVDALNLKVAIETDRIEEQRLALDLERTRKLLDLQVGSQEDYDEIRLRHERIGKQIAENTLLAARIDKDCKDAAARRAEFAKQLPESVAEDRLLAPFHAAIQKQEMEMDELRIRREEVVLRAPVAGRITQVLCQAGQAVRPGEPIAVLSERLATQVIGYAKESGPLPIRENMTVEISRSSQPLTVASAVITRMGAGIEPVPERLWRDPRRPEYGRSFVVSASAPLSLTPGEVILIRLTQ